MSRVFRPFHSSASDAMHAFLRYHRALGKRFATEELALKLGYSRIFVGLRGAESSGPENDFWTD